MLEKTVSIMNHTGLHARPASQFAQAASKFKSQITIVKDGKAVNAKSMISVLSMAINKGCEIVIRAEGDDENLAIDTLVALVSKFAEEDE
ncbi:MAG: HPr family phosphocarrier protein [Bacillota bacterium]